jgi:hypothetical protein
MKENVIENIGEIKTDSLPEPVVTLPEVEVPKVKAKRTRRQANDILLFHDSEVRKHIMEVATNLQKLTAELGKRGIEHDASKLVSPEREIFAERTSDLAETVYASAEYETLVKGGQVAIDHHYANNRHHPEHWPDGIEDMDLVDLMEMLADWAAATKRNKNGNIHKSIEVNSPRFKMTPQLAKILENTVNRYF